MNDTNGKLSILTQTGLLHLLEHQSNLLETPYIYKLYLYILHFSSFS